MVILRPSDYLADPLVCPHCGYNGLMSYVKTVVIYRKKWTVTKCPGCNEQLAKEDEKPPIKASDLPSVPSRRDCRYK